MTSGPDRGGAGMTSGPDRRAARIWRWAWLGGAAALTLVLTVQPLRDPDVWWHLAAGRLILAHGIPSREPFSFLPAAHAWVGQQWLYEVVLARLVDAGGPGLASLVMGILGSAALLLAALAVPRRQAAPAPWLAAVLLVSALVAAPLLGVRGQVVTVAGVAAVVLILSRWREGRARAVWLLPPLLLVWSNLHAGFVAGLALPLVAALASLIPTAGGRERRPPLAPLLAATVLAAGATLVTPAGPGLYAYVARTFANPTLTGSIVEWRSPDFHQPLLRLFEVEAAALVIAWVASRGPDPVDAALAACAAVAALQAQRNVALVAVIALPQLAGYGAQGWRRWREGRAVGERSLPPLRPGPGLSALALVLAGIAAVRVGTIVGPGLGAATARSFEASTYPRGAAGYVAAHLAGHHLYSTYEWGGYLAQRFPTERMVYIYGESAVFGEARLDRYLDIHLIRDGWRRALDEGGMRDAVLPGDSQEVSLLRELGWRVDCRDGASSSVVMSAASVPAPRPRPADLDAPSCPAG